MMIIAEAGTFNWASQLGRPLPIRPPAPMATWGQYRPKTRVEFCGNTTLKSGQISVQWLQLYNDW